MTRIEELKHLRMKAVTDARSVLERAKSEGREMSAEEEARYDAFFADANSLKKQIDREEQLRSVEAELAQTVGDPVLPQTEDRSTRNDTVHRAAFDKFLRFGNSALNADECRALQADNPAGGGFLVPPETFVNDLIKAVDNNVFVRKYATIRRIVKSQSLGIPTLDTDVSDPAWTAEILTGSEDSSFAFGKRELRPSPLAKRVKVSNTLLRLAADAEGIVRDRLAYKFSTVQENCFLNGSGVGQPLGVFTATNDGIGTAQDYSTDNTGTSITLDGLIGAKYSLKPQYWNKPTTAWAFSATAAGKIAKLKTSTNEYIWRGSVRDGEPDTLLGIPMELSAYVPSTFTASLYVGILGDWSYYHIVDSLDLTVQRLVELYAETNQTAFIGRMESDGMPVLAEAFVRVKTGT